MFVQNKVAVVFLLVLVFFSQGLLAEIKFGVIAPRGALKANAKWGELAGYLQQKTGEPVKLYPVTPDKVEKAIASGKVDLMLGNPVTTVILTEKHGASPLATIKKKAGPQFAGVIIAKKGSGITTGKHLKGKKVMAFKFGKSAAAYVFQVYHLRKMGVDPHKDFSSFRQAKKQDDIVLAVKSGVIDGGFVRSGLLEAMEREGKIKISDFTIVDQKFGDGFPLVHSTQTYPEWYVVASKRANTAMVGKIKSALLGLRPADHAAQKAKIKGFVDPLDLKGLKDTLQSLKLAPYNS